MTSGDNTESGKKDSIDTVRPGTVQRDSNLELFRIVLMLAIIAHHYVFNSGLFQECIPTAPTSGKSVFLLLFGAWGKTGINCFLMITGYFMCKSNISLKKFLKLVLEVEFYRIAFFVIFLLTGNTVCSPKLLVKALLPVSSIKDNFTGCFLVFYLFIPFLNLFIGSLTKRNHQLLLAFLLFFYTVIPSGGLPIDFNYVTWFSIIYLIAAYIRCYPVQIFSSDRIWKYAFIVCILLSTLSMIGLDFLFKKGQMFFLSDANKILAVATAVSGFLFFRNLKIPYSKFINTVASSVFGVFLIHANSDAMRTWLWQKTLRCTGFFDSRYLVLHAVLSVVGIFIACTIIDQLRIRLLEKPFFHRFGAMIDGWQVRLTEIFDREPKR